MSARPVRSTIPLLATSVLLLCSLAANAAGDPADTQLNRILARADVPAPPPYRAFRRLEAGNPNTSKHGWLEVWTEYHAGRGLAYTVVREGGYEYVRNKVLRSVLKGEQQLLAEGKPLRAPLVATNYTFKDDGVTDDGLLRILLHPARKAHGIVNGALLLEPDGGGIMRLEGRLVKSPSFWVRDVDVTWKFARMGDAVVPVELSSSARVLFYGRSGFKMTYEYESVDGRVVSHSTRASARENQ